MILAPRLVVFILSSPHFKTSIHEMDSDYPPRLETQEESELLEIASDYSLSHGLVLRPVPPSPSSRLSTTTSIHAPYSLYPTPFPSHLFKQAIDLQPAYNALYANITTNDEFLKEVVGGNVQKVDEFQRKLYEIWSTVKREGIKQVSTFSLSLTVLLLRRLSTYDSMSNSQLRSESLDQIT